MEQLFKNFPAQQADPARLKQDLGTAQTAMKGFFGVGDVPSVMQGQAATDLYNNSELTGILSNLFPGKAAIGMGAGILKGYKTLPRSLMESIGRGASARELFDEHNAVKVGDRYYQFLKDDIRLPEKNTTGSFTVGDLTNGLSGDIKNRRVDFTPKPDNRWGASVPPMDGKPGYIQVNNRLSPWSQRETLAHEIQHPYDVHYNLAGGGTTMDATSPEKVANLQQLLQSSAKYRDSVYNQFDHYQHNKGEVRARLNALLNNDPDHYTGLESVFHKGQYFPEMLWGN